jgi:hypothetical protein
MVKDEQAQVILQHFFEHRFVVPGFVVINRLGQRTAGHIFMLRRLVHMHQVKRRGAKHAADIVPERGVAIVIGKTIPPDLHVHPGVTSHRVELVEATPGHFLLIVRPRHEK